MNRRGVTLLEVMVVIAIIGILAAVAGTQVTQVVRQTRVTSAGKSLESTLQAARARAMLGNCPHVVQLNGPSYAGTGSTRFPTRQGVAVLFRKGQCASTVGSYEDGDVKLDEVPLSVDGLAQGVELGVATELIADGVLDTEGLAFSWSPQGERYIALDGSGTGETGFAAFTTAVPDGMLLPRQPGVTNTDGLDSRVVLVPARGTPVMQR